MGCLSPVGQQQTMGCPSPVGQEQQTVVAKATKESKPKKDSSIWSSETFLDNYVLGVKVGCGAFAQVRLTAKIQDGEIPHAPKEYPYACKVIDLRGKVEQGEIDKSRQKFAQSEASVWREVGKHPNCIQLMDAFWGGCLCYFVMERCKCDLLSALQTEVYLNEHILSRYFYQMAQGIAHCHSVGIVHRDIKPDNFLMSSAGEVKLGDFGLSAMRSKKGSLRGVFGTPPFMCPEMLSSRKYDDKADVWSFGVIVYVLIFGTFPYMPREQSSKGMKEAILNDRPPPKFLPTSRASKTPRTDMAMQFVQRLLIREARGRPSCAEALQMPFMLQASGAPQAQPLPDDLPSLRPMLHAAKQCGAFENQDVSKCDSVDELLQKFQSKYLNLPLPVSEKDRGSRQPKDHVDDRIAQNMKQFAKKTLPGGNCAHTSDDQENWDTDNWVTSSTRSSNGTSRSEDLTSKGSGCSKGTSNPSELCGSDASGLPFRPSGAYTEI